MTDMVLTVRVPELKAPRVIEAICGNHGYQAKIPGPADILPPTMIDNPQTPIQFAREYFKAHVANEVRVYETKRAIGQAEGSFTNDLNLT